MERPAAPTLLPIFDAGAISWQGSAGATSYVVERAHGKEGTWSVVAEKVDDTAVQYRPLFADIGVAKGEWFYRVRARNKAGISDPSNVVGPVAVRHATLVDEMADFSLMHAQQGKLKIKSRDCRKAREDAHRLEGQAGSAIVYRLAERLLSFRLYAFFPQRDAGFRFLVSPDGERYHEALAPKRIDLEGGGDYDSWKAAILEGKPAAPDARFLKIEFQDEAQISRIEIRYGDAE